jgi:hypothetical protein
MIERKAKEALKTLEESHREFKMLKDIRSEIHQRLSEMHVDELSELAIRIGILLGNLGELEAELSMIHQEASDTRKIKFNNAKVFTQGNEDFRIQAAYKETTADLETEYIAKYLWKIIENRREHFSSLSTKLQTRINVLRDERIKSNSQ